MNGAANDKGPVPRQGLDVRKAAEHFYVSEERMRDFLLAHEKEIAEAMRAAAYEAIEELGYLELFLPTQASRAHEWEAISADRPDTSRPLLPPDLRRD